MRRKDKSFIEVRTDVVARFLAKIDTWMQGTVWLTRCSNYFRAPNGRVVTQWPRSARDFWGRTRWFRPGDYVFSDSFGPSSSRRTIHVGAQTAVKR